MRSSRWLLLAALGLPGAAFAQTTQNPQGMPGTQSPPAGDVGGDVVLNPIDPIGEEEDESATEVPSAGETSVARPPLEDTGVDAVGDLEDDEEGDLGMGGDSTGPVDPIGEVDPIGDVNPIGEVDPLGDDLDTIDPGIDPDVDMADEADELDPLAE